MGIRKRHVLTRDTADYVFFLDEDVTVKPGQFGWVPLSDVKEIRAGASIVEIRALNIIERAEVEDQASGGFRVRQVHRIRSGTVSVSVYGDNDQRGKRQKIMDADAILAEFESWDDDGVWLGLGMLIDDVTRGKPTEATQRTVYGPAKPEAGPVKSEASSGPEGAAAEPFRADPEGAGATAPQAGTNPNGGDEAEAGGLAI